MKQRLRPLSPHLQVYRLPLTALVSITHRATGVILTLGALFWVYCLLSVAAGAEAYAALQSGLDSWLARVLLFLWSYALFFHLCHGIRHLIWDTGHGFLRADMDKNASIEIAASIVLTLIVWIGAAFIN